MTSSNDESRVAQELTATIDFRRFVEEMARFTTAVDDLQDEAFRRAFAKEHFLKPEDVTEESVLAELGEERLYNETMAFWEMIRRARQLMAGEHRRPTSEERSS